MLFVPLLLAQAAAQDLSAYAQLAQRCRETGAAAHCRVALEQSHRLKTWAEGRKLWSCYTAVLGAEAEMIAASLSSSGSGATNSPLQEMRAACSR